MLYTCCLTPHGAVSDCRSAAGLNAQLKPLKPVLPPFNPGAQRVYTSRMGNRKYSAKKL